MHAALLYQLTGDPDSTTLESELGREFPILDVQTTRYLDGETLHHGEAAAEVEQDERVPVPTVDGITTETETKQRRKSTSFYVDIDGEWAGIDSSDGEFFVKGMLLSRCGVLGESLEIGLTAWARDFEDKREPMVWGLSYSEGPDEEPIRAGASFHQDASLDQLVRNAEDVSAVGFAYKWGGQQYIRGVICESGYVAVYSSMGPEEFARWIKAEVMPYAVFDLDAADQSTLGDHGGEE